MVVNAVCYDYHHGDEETNTLLYGVVVFNCQQMIQVCIHVLWWRYDGWYR